MTFLIAEDNLRMRHCIIQFLQKHVMNHHTFYEAADGEEAVTLYDRFFPDWVLMDIEMKPVDGFTASKTILCSHPGAKIVVVTSYDDTGYRKTAQEVGAIAFVSKDRLNDLPEIFSAYA